ncbi:MAG: hypothetical protein PHC54_03425 [Candidatus Omnitrophica bacterium]|nr:hypothetical protein [Candidatus Omnitrophota bacterium]MDD5592399.1 hypothetical protein [Candidatus Omnitrophota bacterium]
MEENLKNRSILILVILAVIFFMGTIRSCGTTGKLKLALIELDKEKAASWDTEQKTGELKKELTETKAAHEAVKNELLKERLANQGLKEELEKVTKLKDRLEEDLKEALVTGKSTKTKK